MDMKVAENELVKAPAYPEGWFQVAYSDEVAAGEVITLRYFGRQLVLFRTQSGAAQILDAFCAHLGAHLGVGGVVAGERLRCPFHAWEYGTDGACEAIPYCDVIPPGAAVRSWPTRERSGLVLMWHSPFGNAPLWEPPEMPEYGDQDWDGYLRKSYVNRTSVQELVENIFDAPHFKFVHGNATVPGTKFSFDGGKVGISLHSALPSLGGENTVIGTLHGIGLAEYRSSGYGGVRSWWIAYTPIDRDTVQTRFSMLSIKSHPEDPNGKISRRGLHATLTEFEKDFPIWENKTYRPRPALCKDDGPIGRYRLWVGQFFAETAGG